MTKTKVLIVEDNDSIADLYGVYLDSDSFESRRSADGEKALADIAEFKPDIILLDIMMPNKSGFEVLEEIRKKPETAKISVIMFTALSQPKDKERAEALGIQDYLVKSQVTASDVLSTIEKYIPKDKQ